MRKQLLVIAAFVFATVLVQNSRQSVHEAAALDGSKRPSISQTDPDKYVTVVAKGAAGVKPGSQFTIDFEATIEAGWHMYSLHLDENLGVPTKITVGDPGPFFVGDVPTESKPKAHHSELMGGMMLEHYEKATFQLPVDVPEEIADGEYKIPVSFRYQICDANMCLPPQTFDFMVPVVVGDPPKAAASSGAVAPKLTQTLSDSDRYVEVTGRGIAGVEAGQNFVLDFEVKIEAGWHMYSLLLDESRGVPTKITVGESPFTEAGPITESKPKSHFSELMGGMMLEHYETAKFQVPLTAPDDLADGVHEVPVSFRYQICDANMCLPPVTLEFKLPVIKGDVAAAVALGTGTGTGPGTDAGTGTAKAVGVEIEQDLRVTAQWPRRLEPGQSFELRFTAEIDPLYWIYGIEQDPENAVPTSVTAENWGPLEVTGPLTESPAPKRVEKSDGVYLKHLKRAEFTLPVKVKDDAAKESTEVDVTFVYQLCNDLGCKLDTKLPITLEVHVGVEPPAASLTEGTALGTEEPPARLVFEATVPNDGNVRPGETFQVDYQGRLNEEGAVIPAIEASIVEQTRARGFWGIILFGIVGALFALVTPCVYPMIPITVSVFTKHAEDGKSNVFFLAVIFCLGIVVTFTAIGFIASLILGPEAGNFFATNPTINLILGGLFVWFAFSLFGYYNISLPSWLTTKATGAGSGGGVLSVILMGFVFSITTFTCVGPIVATLLALAVTGGGQWLSLVGMVAFSATFSIPFFFLALFPKMLQGMPRSGGWLNAVKVGLGFVELAAAFKFFAVVPLGYFDVNALFRELVLFIWFGLFVATALYLFGWIRFPHDSKLDKRSLPRLGFVAASLALALYFGWGATGRLINPNLEAQILVPSLFAKAHGAGGHGGSDSEGDSEKPLRQRMIAGIENSSFWSTIFETDPVKLPWRVFSRDTGDDLKAALAEVRGSGKPVFINFTGHV